jgi:ComF family protein
LAGSSDVECGACIADPPHYDASCAAFVYAYPVDALIQALKYGGQLALAGLFAHKLHQRIGEAAGVDLIVPLPLHPARLAERGFNQAAEIAKALSRLTGIAMDAQLGRRVRNTAPQTDLPWPARVANMRQAFACEQDLAGLSVAVVDDVMTTGATLDEFARTLKRSGAARVENWVVARTPRGV